MEVMGKNKWSVMCSYCSLYISALRFVFFFFFFFLQYQVITDNLFNFSFSFIESFTINHFETYSLYKHIYRWEKAQIAKSNNSNDNNYGTSSMSSATQPVNEGTQNNR
jgi:hypothetical protein